MNYQEAVIFAITHFDATPCGKGWVGTKPPGCKRSSKASSNPGGFSVESSSSKKNAFIQQKKGGKTGTSENSWKKNKSSRQSAKAEVVSSVKVPKEQQAKSKKKQEKSKAVKTVRALDRKTEVLFSNTAQKTAERIASKLSKARLSKLVSRTKVGNQFKTPKNASKENLTKMLADNISKRVNMSVSKLSDKASDDEVLRALMNRKAGDRKGYQEGRHINPVNQQKKQRLEKARRSDSIPDYARAIVEYLA